LTAEEVSGYAFVTPNDSAGIRFDCSSAELTSVETGAIGFSFSFKAFEAGEHQDMMVAIFDGDNEVGSWMLNNEYPVSWPAAGCATITIPIDLSKLSDPPALQYAIGLGPNYVRPTPP
jgi:hypothetical protein